MNVEEARQIFKLRDIWHHISAYPERAVACRYVHLYFSNNRYSNAKSLFYNVWYLEIIYQFLLIEGTTSYIRSFTNELNKISGNVLLHAECLYSTYNMLLTQYLLRIFIKHLTLLLTLILLQDLNQRPCSGRHTLFNRLVQRV